MNIEVNLYASLSGYRTDGGTRGPLRIEMAAGATVFDLLQRLGVPREEVKLIFRNGVHAQGSQRLCDGDRIGMFPPIGGG